MRSRVVPGVPTTSVKDLSGSRYGSLLVLSFAGWYHTQSQRYSCWNCQCSCGREKVIRGSDVTSGRIVSCGCHKDSSSKVRLTTHGHCPNKVDTKEHRAWVSMKQRCLNPKDFAYHNYGGRGICIHHDWINSFSSFLSHIGLAPTPEHSLDRIDSNGNYEPGNVRWATRHQQCRNRRTNVILTHDGRSMTMQDWSNETGIAPQTMRVRLDRGWSHSECVTIPPRQGRLRTKHTQS